MYEEVHCSECGISLDKYENEWGYLNGKPICVGCLETRVENAERRMKELAEELNALLLKKGV